LWKGNRFENSLFSIMEKQKYSFRNRSLKDMKGEEWRPVRGYEDHYMVSNYGRIKSLEKHIEFLIPGKHTVSYIKPEKILSQGVSKEWNSLSKENIFRLTVTFCIDQKMKTMSVSRVVWGVFGDVLDFKKDQLYISFKDGDSRNTHFKNLYTAPQSITAKAAYKRNRLIDMTPYVTPASIAKRGAARWKIITQYDLNGNRLKCYSSIKAAEMETGIKHSNISMAAKGKKKQMGGFIWRYGKGRKKINPNTDLLVFKI
jgi:hypothetical protein